MSLARNLSRRTLAWGAALLLWVGFVWGHSLVGGATSSAESGRSSTETKLPPSVTDPGKTIPMPSTSCTASSGSLAVLSRSGRESRAIG